MEESYETFEEELGSPRADSPPLKSVQDVRRPEMYITRKVTEEMAPVPRQPKAEARTSPREPSVPQTVSLHKALSIQNLSQIDKPWENVTLNRCLFVAITILVLTSGFQRLHETLRGQGTAEEEEVVELRVRRPGTLRHRGQPPEPEITLWEVMFWWLPDLNDEEDEEEDNDDDGEDKRVKSKKGATVHSSRGLRNKPLPGEKLTKLREEKLKDRRAKKNSSAKLKSKKERDATELDEAEEEELREKEYTPKKNKRLEEQKEKKKTPK